jgi:flagellar motor protein MotB
MTVVGRSAFNPVVPNDSDANRRRNRRVEIVLTQTP